LVIFAHWDKQESKIIITTGCTSGDSLFDITIKELNYGHVIFNGWVQIPKDGWTPISIDTSYTSDPHFQGIHVELFEKNRTIYERYIDSQEYNKLNKYEIQGFTIYLRENEHITANIKHFNDFWESDHMDQYSKHLQITGKILDIGANIGNHTLMFRKYFPELEIYAFEPLFYNYELLQKNVSKIHGVHTFKVALSNKSDILKISDYGVECNSGISSISDTGESVVAITLDSLGLEGVSFMKIDVEGWERCVIEGARETIKSSKPKLWIEDFSGETIKYIIQEFDYFIQDQRGGENYLLSPKI